MTEAMVVIDKASMALEEISNAVEAAGLIIPFKDCERTRELCALEYLMRRIKEHRDRAQAALERLYDMTGSENEMVLRFVTH